MWRCFIKGVSSTHVILTFIPASLKDVKILNAYINTASTNSLLNDSSEEENDSKSTKNDKPYKNRSESLILPIYIYDCPLSVTMNSFINPNKNVCTHTKDIYEDYCFNLRSGVYESDPYIRSERSRSPNPKSEDSETGCELKICMRQHCRALVLVHVKCFVVALFKSLQCKYSVSSADVQYAVDQCEEATKDIDITDYLCVMCTHMNAVNVDDVQCTQPQHQPLQYLIQDKFAKIVSMSFQPVPTHPDYYYCHPSVMPAVRTTTKDEDSDDEMSLEMVECESSSDSDSCIVGQWHGIPTIGITKTTDSSSADTTDNVTETDITEGDTGDESRPLFLHLTTTIYCQGGTVLPSVPIKELPTCINKLLDSDRVNPDPEKIRITLDMIYLTLPLEVHAITKEFAPKCHRNASFCSTSPLHSDGSGGEDSSDDDFERTIARSQDNILTFNNLSDMQLQAVRTLKQDIEWLLRDEIAARLLDKEPVSADTLNTVIKHVDASEGKLSCKKDVINLSFVYGSVQSHAKFLNEFKNISFNMVDGNSYELIENHDLYYLGKKKTSEQDSVDSVDGDQSNICQQSDVSSIFGTEDDFNADSDDDHNFDWLVHLDKKRNILPNFWLILRIEQETVTIYFHCRFLELQTSKVSSYLRVHRKVIYCIKDLCKRVNQSLLLQNLHDTRNCDRLLEPEDDRKDLWFADGILPPITRHPSFARPKSGDEGASDGTEFQQIAYLETSLKFMPGFFRCDVVWETQFSLHPRLKTGPGKSGLSRGIQALRTVLNKFSVSNRSNMFVYQDNLSNVFYLRLHENCSSMPYQQENSRAIASYMTPADSENQVFRSPSIVSLPLGQQKLSTPSFDSNLIDVRPRVRSVGEKERESTSAATAAVEDTIALRVHGITNAGLDVRRDLVQVLQNRLDDAVLEVLSMMLARNAMCPLTPEDVHFLQRPFHPPEHIVRLSIPTHVNCDKMQLTHFIQYLRNDLLQFLNVPKYTDSGLHNHFKDYSEPNVNLRPLIDDFIFLYNQSQNTSSGNRGIACIALAIVYNKLGTNETFQIPVSNQTDYMMLFKDMTFQEIVHVHIFPNDLGKNFIFILLYLFIFCHINGIYSLTKS